VARAAVQGFLLGRRVIVPGMVAKILMLAARLTPHPVLVPIMRLLLRPAGKGAR
jgi:hypothetical protein